MNKNKLSKWAKKHSRDIKNAYSIAITNGYDINSTEDVLKILKKTNPEKATEEHAKALSGMLRIFDKMLRRTLGKKAKPEKEKVVN